MKGILENIRKQREEYRHSAHWLHNSISYDTGCYLEEKHKILSKQLFNSLGFQDRYKQEQKLKDYETLLANLFYQNRKPVNVSLNQDDWKHTQYNNCSYFTVTIIHKLLNLQYISMVKGYNFKEGSKMTRIWATDKLLKIFPEYNTGVGWKPVEVVILKDDKGKLIEYKDTIETRRVRSILLNVNKVNDQADIRYQKFKISASLMAIFRKKFTLYGRLHTKGYSHLQGFSGDEREKKSP